MIKERDANVHFILGGGRDTTIEISTTMKPGSISFTFTATTEDRLYIFNHGEQFALSGLVIQQICPTLPSMSTTAYRYRYNGKEQLSRFSGWYDYGFRMYDAGVGRFLSVDPLTKDFPNISPFIYAGNTPIRGIDEDGLKLRFAAGVSKEFKQAFALTVKHLKAHKADGMLAKLEKLSAVITITQDMKGLNDIGPSFNRKSNEINWSPEVSLLTNSGNHISSATILIHEADHALQFNTNKNQYAKDVKNEDKNPKPNYSNAEEKRVITGSETRTAKQLGEIKEGEVTRTDHYGNMLYYQDINKFNKTRKPSKHK